MLSLSSALLDNPVFVLHAEHMNLFFEPLQKVEPFFILQIINAMRFLLASENIQTEIPHSDLPHSY